MKPSVKTLLIISAVAGSLSTSVAFAAASPSSGAQGASTSQSKILSDIDGILHATASRATALTNQVDQFMSNIENSNTSGAKLPAPQINANSTTVPEVTIHQTGLNNYINYKAALATNQNVTSTLSHANTVINPPKSNSSQQQESVFLNALFQNTGNANSQSSAGGDTQMSLDMNAVNQDALLYKLTTGTPAADTLYMAKDKLQNVSTDSDSNSDYLQSNQKPSVAKPTKNYTSYMSAPTFTSPFNGSYFAKKGKNGTVENAYSTDAAKAYLSYLTGAGLPLGGQISWYKLAPAAVSDKSGKNHPNSIRAKNLLTLKNNPTYQKYQYTIRQIVASRSMVTDILNQLLMERAPSAQLAQQANVPKQYETVNNYNPVTKKKETTLSPLQLENYIANHRVNSSKWYQAMSTASPAVVQRETLFVMAEILSKMQQAHLDREKMIELQALQASENVEAMKKVADTQVTAVNNVINSLPGVAKSSNSGSGGASNGS